MRAARCARRGRRDQSRDGTVRAGGDPPVGHAARPAPRRRWRSMPWAASSTVSATGSATRHRHDARRARQHPHGVRPDPSASTATSRHLPWGADRTWPLRTITSSARSSAACSRFVAGHEPPGGVDHPPPRHLEVGRGEDAADQPRALRIPGDFGDVAVGHDLARLQSVGSRSTIRALDRRRGRRSPLVRSGRPAIDPNRGKRAERRPVRRPRSCGYRRRSRCNGTRTSRPSSPSTRAEPDGVRRSVTRCRHTTSRARSC